MKNSALTKKLKEFLVLYCKDIYKTIGEEEPPLSTQFSQKFEYNQKKYKANFQIFFKEIKV